MLLGHLDVGITETDQAVRPQERFLLDQFAPAAAGVYART